jgi:predicted oxidoreductase
MNMNMTDDMAIDRDNGTLNYCRLNKITIQPWSPFQYGFFQGTFIGSEKFPALNAKLDEIAGRYNVSPTAVALAWLLRHPAKFQPVIGTMNTARLKECVKAADITLSREEWYEIFLAAGHRLP